MYKEIEFSDLVGKTLTKIERRNHDIEVYFFTACGQEYKMHHRQDCCENVYLEDVTGDLDDLIGHPITLAEVSTNSDNPPPDADESHTWTFYKLATIKGYVDLRWLGQSNGYYSESVEFEKKEQIA